MLKENSANRYNTKKNKNERNKTLRLRLITILKIIGKTTYLCQKIKNKLRRGETNSYFLAISIEKSCLGFEEEKLFHKK